jgi:hypothetical protein
MSYKFIWSKNQDENKAKGLRFHETRGLWNALIPKCDGLVAKGSQTLASKVAHYTERGMQK